jgi:hypothetical protein
MKPNRSTKEIDPDYRIGCQLRFKLESDEYKKNTALEAQAPNAVIVAAQT